MHTLDRAPIRSESTPQKRSSMARVLEGFHSFTCKPTRSSAIGVSHLPLHARAHLLDPYIIMLRHEYCRTTLNLFYCTCALKFTIVFSIAGDARMSGFRSHIRLSARLLFSLFCKKSLLVAHSFHLPSTLYTQQVYGCIS